MILKLFATWSINFTTAWLCACGGIVANDQGLPSGVGLEFRPPITADDWVILLKLRIDDQSCLSCRNWSWALYNCRLYLRPATLAANPMLIAGQSWNALESEKFIWKTFNRSKNLLLKLNLKRSYTLIEQCKVATENCSVVFRITVQEKVVPEWTVIVERN